MFRYLGLDLGSKTLGMAISDTTGMIATRLGTLYFDNEDYDSLLEPLGKIISENEVNGDKDTDICKDGVCKI